MMADFTTVPQVAPFVPDSDPTSVSQRWKRWSDRFDNLLVAMNVTNNARKKALLLHLAGDAVFDIFSGLVIDAIPDDADPDVTNEYTVAKTALDNYFSPKKNVEFERYTFRMVKQTASETIDAYHNRLRSLAKYCEFSDLDAEIKSHITQTCRSSRLRRRALTDSSMTLQQLIDVGRSMEVSERQTKAIEGGMNNVAVSADTTVAQVGARPTYQDQHRSASEKCRNCGKDYPHNGGRTSCPAYGTSCRSCGKPNHWSTCCRTNSTNRLRVDTARQSQTRASFNRQPTAKRPSRGSGRGRRQSHQQLNQLDNCPEASESSDDDIAYLFSVGTTATKQPRTFVTIRGNNISMLIDSGASVNIIDEVTYDSFVSPPNLIKAKTRIFTYGASEPVVIHGTFESDIESSSRKTVATFYVTKGTNGCLLSYKTALELDLIKITVNQLNDRILSSSCAGSTITIDDLERKYPQLFKGVGKLKDHQVKLYIDKSVRPVAQMNRRVPFHLQDAVEKELKQMLADDIIEPVTGPASWVSPLVIVNKPKQPGKIRICVDSRWANTAILRQRHVMPTLDDLIHQLNGSQVFTKLDLRNAFLQLELAPYSRYITTFSSHIGLFRYKRLSFGLSVSSELFQSTISQLISNIPGVINICDDILIHAASVVEHDRTLDAVAKRLADSGLTLHKEKCQLNQAEISFYGCVFSASGVSVNPERIRFLDELPAPTSAAEISSVLGMFGYAQRHLPDFATLTEPLRRLAKSGTVFKWTAVEQESFDTLKAKLR